VTNRIVVKRYISMEISTIFGFPLKICQ